MDQADQDRSEPRAWFARWHLSWPMLFLAGWLLYEFTAQPGLAALIACAKFGWPDVRTAFWLRRVDPDRWRGQACFWSYLTYGLWKVAIMATLTMIVLGFLGEIVNRLPGQPANPGLSPVFGGALAAATMGFGISFPTAYVALWLAGRNGVRIWLGNAPRRAYEERFWPPRHDGINMLPFVGATICFMTFCSVGVVAAAFGDLVLPKGVHPVFFALTVLFVACLVLFCVIGAGVRVCAPSPRECWNAAEDEIYQTRSGEEGESAT